MRKYFFFDIDGTLTTPLTADYPDSTREAIRQLQARGHFVSLATGRIQADAAEVARELEIPALVSDGGNAVTVEGEILYHEGLPLPLC
ncbi:MAG: HAD-IIB family hydrolase, partial [Dialister sp.]|nr:HAD-IIB family hydrolase [Dialister sp.]